MLAKKILILASWYPENAAKVSGIFIQDQAEVLSQSYDVCVLTSRIVGYRDWKRVFLRQRAMERQDKIPVYRQALLVPPMAFFHLWMRLYEYSAKRAFSRILAEWGKPDIIHAHVVLPSGWLAVRLGQQYSVPVVLTEHSGPFSMHLRSKAHERLVRRILKKAKKLVAVSPALAEQIRAFHPEADISVVGNVIRTDFFVPNSARKEKPRRANRFLCVALLHEGKGIHCVLQAMKLLAERGIRSFEVFIGGDGPVRPKLVKLAMALGVSGRCRFLGMLERDQVRHWMQTCDVFVLPSLGETFGVVLGEAMACGKPVIATRCGGPEYVVTPETGLLVDAGDPVQLAEAMNLFVTNQVVFKSKVIRQSIVSRFGEDVFLRRLSSIYDQVIGLGYDGKTGNSKNEFAYSGRLCAV
jgi:glycosyltransferase involved in cell wall biosynthesis